MVTGLTSVVTPPTCGHLVAEAAAAAVDHHAHLALVVDAHLLGGVVVVDLVHHLDLGVVVARSQGAQLGGIGGWINAGVAYRDI